MPSATFSAQCHQPIGVFDSGVGGLSVLRALRAQLPHEHFIYVADSAYAPYGEKGSAFVAARCLAIARELVEDHGAKALVIACNTATAAGADALRARWPQWPIVGIEPALKPAAARTRTQCVGVLATRGTLQSARFARLLAAQPPQVRFVLQPCDGLADAIEQEAILPDGGLHAGRTDALIARYLAALGPLGPQSGAIDTLVLGCTHYPLAEAAWRRLAGLKAKADEGESENENESADAVALLEPGPPVARHARRLLAAAGLLNPGPAPGAVRLLATGSAAALLAAARRLNLAAAESAPGTA